MGTKAIPGHTITHIKQDDFPTLIDFLVASKRGLSINRFLWRDWPNEPAQRAQYASTLQHSHAREDMNSYKVVDDVTGEIVAHLATSHLKSIVEAPERQPVPSGPDGIVQRVFNEVIESTTTLNKNVARRERIEITWLYVRPESRGHEIGCRLVQLAREEAEAKELPLVVVSEPQAHEFFLAFGFEDVQHVEIDIAQWAPPFSGYGAFRLHQMELKGLRDMELTKG